MATDAQTLVNTSAASKYASLSERDLLLCLVGYYASQNSITAAQAVVTASQQGYAKLSDRELDECYLAIIS